MRRIHIIRNAYLTAYLQALREHGVDPARLLQIHRMPADFEFIPDYMVAAPLLHRFIGDAVKHGPPGVISTAAASYNAASQINPFSVGAAASVSLLDAIHRHNQKVLLYSPENRFSFDSGELRGRWIKSGRSPLAETEIFCVANLIGHVRTLLGPLWLPDAVQVSVVCPTVLRSMPMFEELEISEVKQTTVLQISVEQLWRSNRSFTQPERDHPSDGDLSRADTDLDFFQSLRLVMMSYARVGCLRMEDTAAAAGLSRRTLQRRLQDAGLTYSNLVDQVRYEIARELLSQSSELTVTQVGYELGYNDPGSFSRAFRRFAGLPPAEYRRRMLEKSLNSAA